ncbi:MAG TPA: hypothetical protein PK587_11160 [Syntrophales bacterium]|nr:hypothetical protein [Syntrophales bacterium]
MPLHKRRSLFRLRQVRQFKGRNSTGQKLTAEDVISFCRERLAPYKVPKIVEFLDALPKSAVGKVLRRELKEMEAGKKRT